MAVNPLNYSENISIHSNVGINSKTRKIFFPVIVLPLFAFVLALHLHLTLPNNQEFNIRYTYAAVLATAAVLYLVLCLLSLKIETLSRKLKHFVPLVTVAVLLLELWDLATLKFALLELPYFPGPDKVLSVFRDDWQLLLISTLHSIRLMFIAYLIGVSLGLVTGITMGWSKKVNYWLTPFLRIIGPIPATAWIPVAMVVFPNTFSASVFLIVLAVWFPVTVMTSSGIANVRNSFFEVAKTLGADRKYLIFKVAIPAAYPNIFIGLFMGMGSSFLTLIVGEMLGVKAGLGWYINWAQGWAELHKVYASLILMAVMFSSLLTLLFKFKDRVLIWQKGLIKW
ncbi:ABC transporter permease [Acetivibrio straminisolvens]|jgi:NitT/TauT family transport system permease protein|uniref:ABC transporter permease n=1 Tax=Acetivibrio straminisolvens TaxID=253314 RepID=UPI002240B607|nr:ABC transporter permease subunit [Acetivibrio straminisolvens]